MSAKLTDRKHNHAQCVAHALKSAESVCLERAARFTTIRKRVLELVWSSHEPVGAYDILEKLSRERKAAPPTVYRALEFLMDVGLVHRIDSLNAFVGCISPAREHVAQFLVCRACRHVSEIESNSIQKVLQRQSRRSGFHLENSSFEVKGLCDRCASTPA